MFINTRAEDLHGRGTVLVLRPFILALGHDSCGKMGDANGGVGGVDVLSAAASGSVGIDLQLLFLNVDGNVIVNFRDHENAGEGSVALLIGIEGRQPDE